MYSDDFIKKQVRQQAISMGASESRAEEFALRAVISYKQNQFKKAGQLLDKCIKDAVKQTAKDGKQSEKAKMT